MKKNKFIPRVNIKKLAKKASKTLAKVYKKVEKKPKKIKRKIKTNSQIKFFQKLREDKVKLKYKEKIIKLQTIKERNHERKRIKDEEKRLRNEAERIRD